LVDEHVLGPGKKKVRPLRRNVVDETRRTLLRPAPINDLLIQPKKRPTFMFMLFQDGEGSKTEELGTFSEEGRKCPNLATEKRGERRVLGGGFSPLSVPARETGRKAKKKWETEKGGADGTCSFGRPLFVPPCGEVGRVS